MKRALFLTLVATCLPSTAQADKSTDKACADAYVEGQLQRNHHKLLRSRDVFRTCARSACKDFIVKDCSTWLDMVQASLPAVIPLASDEAGNALTAVKVDMDGETLVSSIDGRSIEVDPGTHVFTFEASDGTTVEKSVLVPESDKWVRVVITLPRAPPHPPEDAPASRSTVSSGVSLVSPDPPRAARVRPSSPWRRVGVALAGAGVLGLGGSAYFAFDALSKKNAAGCNEGSCPNTRAQTEWNAARSSGTTATGLFIGAGALALSGAFVFMLAPRGSVSISANVATGWPNLAVSSAW